MDGLPLLEWLVHRPPKYYKILPMILISLQDLTERPYLQPKTPHTEHGEIKLALTWDSNPYCLGFIVLESTMQMSREK